ncbi:MAG: leucine-rich repeat protein [Bacteroidales bacterium]|nr:leucine-rich repeat protein [Bacteroidales bacterium]
MLIEQKTTYSYKLKYLENPSFDKVRGFAKKFIDDLPKELVDELYSQLDRGVVQIDSEPQMLVYLYSFGNMHQAKLNKAFENIPEILFDQPEINIIDYGCGQAIGTMCYIDFIRQKGISQKVKRVTLIEPSEICLNRAALHVSAFCPDAEIVTINKTFDDLDAADIVCDEEITTLHILSNVLDLEFDLERFAELISDNLKGYNQFVCVGPYFGFSDKDKRMENLYLLLNGDENFCQFYDKYELNPNRPWTAHIRCFSVGELEEELSTKVTWGEINNVVKDEYGVVYSKDGKWLLKGNLKLKTYMIKDGTQMICAHAFNGCSSLQQITIPNSVTSIGDCAFCCCSSLQQITIPNSITSIGDSAFIWCSSLRQITIPKSITNIGNNPFANCPLLTLESQSFRFIVEKGFFIDRQEQNIITYIGGIDTSFDSVRSIGDFYLVECKPLQHIIIPNSVTSVGDSAFWGCSSIQQITIPNSVTSIGVSAFNGCSFLQQITLPNSITSIGDSAFCGCSSLQQITVPNSITSIGNKPFANCPLLTLESQSFRFIVDNGLLIDSQEQTIISYVGYNKEITIPNSVTSIGDWAFSCCESLQKITIPNSVTSIGEWVFSYCSSLQNIIIPNSVTSIGKSAFDGCSSLKQITILNSVTSIGQNAFEKCELLQQIIIPEGSEDHFKQMLPEELWDKLYYLKKAVVVEPQVGGDDESSNNDLPL